MSADEETIKIDPVWLIQRGDKQFSIKSTKVLLAVYHEGRLRPGDKIRSLHDPSWLAIESFDWKRFESPKIDHPNAQVSSKNNKSSTPKGNTDEPSTVKVDWWTDGEIHDQAKPIAFFKGRWKLFAGLCGMAAVSVAIWMINRPQLGEMIAGRSLLESPARTLLPSSEPRSGAQANVPPTGQTIELPHTLLSGSDDLNQTPENSKVSDVTTSSPVEEKQSIDTEKVNPTVSVGSTVEMPEGTIEPKASDVEPTATIEVPSLAKTIDTSEAVPDMKGAKSVERLADDELVTLERTPSMARIIDQKTADDKSFDEIMASMTFYKDTSKMLRVARDKWLSSNTLIEQLKTKIGENELLGKQGSQRILAIQSELQLAYEEKAALAQSASQAGATSITLQMQMMIRDKISRLNKEGNDLNSHMQRLVVDIQNKKREIQREMQNTNLAERELSEVCKKEAEATKRVVDLIDFFGERNLSVHERLRSQASHEFAAVPDFFLAYLIHSAAAIRMNELEIPAKNLSRMRSQAALLSEFERNSRSQALECFEALAVTLVGLSQHRQSQHSDALQSLKVAIKMDHSNPEILLVRGLIGMDSKGRPDGFSYFRKAIELEKRNARMYRVPLSVLVSKKEVPDTIIKSLLSELVKRAPRTDEHAWIVAAEAAERLEAYDDAKAYLQNVTNPLYDERKQLLTVKLESIKPDSNVSEPQN